MNEKESHLRWAGDDDFSDKPEENHQPEKDSSVEIDHDHCTEMFNVLTEIAQRDRKNLTRESHQVAEKLEMDKYTDNQIASFINNSRQSDWTTKPAFYSALIRQAVERAIFILDPPEDEDGSDKPPLKLI